MKLKHQNLIILLVGCALLISVVGIRGHLGEVLVYAGVGMIAFGGIGYRHYAQFPEPTF